MTPLYMRLRACERFGINPGEWDRLSVTMQTLLEINEILRQAEEGRELEMLALGKV